MRKQSSQGNKLFAIRSLILMSKLQRPSKWGLEKKLSENRKLRSLVGESP